MGNQGRLYLLRLCILASCVFDGLDGKVARLTGTTSEFGVQLDSLADLVAFGVVPATMTYLWMLEGYGRLGLMAAFLFMACGALRLARFNVQASTGSKKHFVGLPIPGAACTLATLVLLPNTSLLPIRRRFCRSVRWYSSMCSPFSWSALFVFILSRKSAHSRLIPSAGW